MGMQESYHVNEKDIIIPIRSDDFFPRHTHCSGGSEL